MKKIAYVCLMGICSSAWGQTPPASPAPDAAVQSWIENRVRFIQELYALNTAEVDTLRRMHHDRLDAQNEHQKKYETTLRSIITGLANTQGQEMPDAIKAQLSDVFSGQLDRIHAQAPMSYASILGAFEKTLSKDQVEAAHARIKSKFAARLSTGRVALTTANMDTVVGEPVIMPNLQIVPAILPPVQPRAVTPPTPLVKNAAPGATSTDRSLLSTSATPPKSTPSVTIPPPVQPVVPEPPPPPAPAMAEWSKALDAAIAKYAMTDAQKTQGKGIFDTTMSRATAYRVQNKAAFEEAEKMPDAAKKAERLAELSKPLNVMYHQYTRRVESLTSIEQRLKAEGKDKSPPPTPTTPTGGGH